jgi:hypothetical protein
MCKRILVPCDGSAEAEAVSFSTRQPCSVFGCTDEPEMASSRVDYSQRKQFFPKKERSIVQASGRGATAQKAEFARMSKRTQSGVRHWEMENITLMFYRAPPAPNV